MSLSTETCLRGVLHTLQTRITPALADDYAQEVSRLAGLVLTITTNGLDDAASVPIAENDAMRRLFADAAGVVTDADLAARLRAAADAGSSGYRLSELDRDNAALRRLLVDLHVALEDQRGDAAHAVASRIWRMLGDFEVARAPRR